MVTSMADAAGVEGPSKGQTYLQIQQRLSCTPTYISQWKKRFLSDGLSGLHTRHRGRVPKVLSPPME